MKLLVAAIAALTLVGLTIADTMDERNCLENRRATKSTTTYVYEFVKPGEKKNYCDGFLPW